MADSTVREGPAYPAALNELLNLARPAIDATKKASAWAEAF
jgi:hypothetical protein